MPLYSTNWHGILILISQVRLVMGIDAACSDVFMVNGKQVLSLLPSVCLGVVEAFLCLLIRFLKQELKSMPKGVISSAVRKAKWLLATNV